MRLEVSATAPREEGAPWLEASECAENLEDALAIIRQWVEAGEIKSYGRGPVTFHVEVTP